MQTFDSNSSNEKSPKKRKKSKRYKRKVVLEEPRYKYCKKRHRCKEVKNISGSYL